MSASAVPSPFEIVKLRARALEAVRAYFAARDFIEVDTPTIVPSPGLDVHLSAFEVLDPNGVRAGWLATSPEYQMKRLLVAGAERIFQITRSYRAEEVGVLHEREFTMIEWYRANATSRDVMRDTQGLVEHLAEELPGVAADNALRGDGKPWPTRAVAEVVRDFAGCELEAFECDEDFFRAWVDRVQPRLGKDGPVFVTEWPASMASLARLNENGNADRFEAFFQGVELCNGFGELTDAQEQRGRFEHDQAERRALGKPELPIDEKFLDALASGMPESGGNAVGFDRVLMALVGAESIQAVMPFPEERL